MTTDREKIIRKIKKCMALSASSNEHEAAAALRQAKALMEQHGISALDMQAAEASERRARAGAMKQPGIWETLLACKVADAFGCKIVFTRNYLKKCGEWGYIGIGAAPEIAEYVFKVLFRQCKAARSEHIKRKLNRCKPGTRTRRADLYCEGWVQSVTGLITSFAGGKTNQAAIDVYIATRYPNLSTLEAKDRNAGRNLRDYEENDYHHGKAAGRDAQLNRGVGGAEQRQALGVAS